VPPTTIAVGAVTLVSGVVGFVWQVDSGAHPYPLPLLLGPAGMRGSAIVTPSFGKEPNASHMCGRIKFHTYDRRYKCIPEQCHNEREYHSTLLHDRKS
jgi:hypothetical protein